MKRLVKPEDPDPWVGRGRRACTQGGAHQPRPVMNPTAHSQPRPQVVQTWCLMGRLRQSPAVPWVGASPLCCHLDGHQQDSTGLLSCSQPRLAMSPRENPVWPSALRALIEKPHSKTEPPWPRPSRPGTQEIGGGPTARVPQLCRGHSRPVGMKGIDKGLDAREWIGPGGHGLSSRGEVSKGASGGAGGCLPACPLSPGPQERMVTLPRLWERVVFPRPPGSAGFLEQTRCFSIAHPGNATHPPRPPRLPLLCALS